MQERNAYEPCPKCGAMINGQARECPECKAPIAAQAPPPKWAAAAKAPAASTPAARTHCPFCAKPLEPGTQSCPWCMNKFADAAIKADDALSLEGGAPVPPPPVASAAAAVPVPRAPCHVCGKMVELSAMTCAFCNQSLLVDVALALPVPASNAPTIASALSRLGPPAPSIAAIQQALRNEPVVLVRDATREWAAAAVAALQRNGMGARYGRFSAPGKTKSKKPFPFKSAGVVVLVAGLIGAGIYWAQFWKQRTAEPLRSFANPAQTQPQPTPATPPGTPPSAADPATSHGSVAAVTVNDGLVFGGRNEEWWEKRLQSLRTSGEPGSETLYALAKERAERAGLKVTEKSDAVSVEPREEVQKVLQQAGAR